MYKDGESRIEEALDVRKIIETHQNVKLLKHLLFRKQSRMLFRLQRENLLEFGGSESDRSSICSSELDEIKDDEARREAFVEDLEPFRTISGGP